MTASETLLFIITVISNNNQSWAELICIAPSNNGNFFVDRCIVSLHLLWCAFDAHFQFYTVSPQIFDRVSFFITQSQHQQSANLNKNHRGGPTTNATLSLSLSPVVCVCVLKFYRHLFVSNVPDSYTTRCHHLFAHNKWFFTFPPFLWFHTTTKKYAHLVCRIKRSP